MIIALALSPSLDVTYEVDELRRSDITRPTRVTRVAGGKALNVARVAVALGAEVRVVAALGGHVGAWVADLLSQDGVTATVVPIAGVTRTCSAIVESATATSSTDVYEPATPLLPSEWAQFQQSAIALVGESPAWVAISGSLPEGVPPKDAAELLTTLRRTGARIAVDSSGAGLRAMGPSADLVKVNRAEAAELLDAAPQDAAAAAHGLRRLWGCDVIVTDGIREGCALLGGREIAVPPPRAPGRFPTGSGDAFFGGLLVGLDGGVDAAAVGDPAAGAAGDPAAAVHRARDAAERNAAVPGQGVLA